MPLTTRKDGDSGSRRSPLGWVRNRHFFVLDVCVLCLTPIIAVFLRVETLQKAAPYFQCLLFYIASSLVIRLVVFYFSGLYSRYWQYATADELMRIFWAVFISTVCITITSGVYLLSKPEMFLLPRSLPVIDGLLVLLATGASRFSVRLYHGGRRPTPRHNAKRALVVGAGLSGQLIVKDLRFNPDTRIVPVGFLDDDAVKHNLHILGLPVLGGREALPRIVKEHQINQVIIAMPSATGKVVRECLALCEKAGVTAMAVPSLSGILDGRISINKLRKVNIEDLLRREPVNTDTAAIHAMLCGKRVLVTGGGGSIGSELCRQVLLGAPSDLAILGHGENSVFDSCNELRAALQRPPPPVDGAPAGVRKTRVHAFVADIRFAKRVGAILEEFKPDIIFHAAAHKHVPLMETNPDEAISNNVFGTKNMVDAALACGVERFVMISTDKAVNPTSVMGASKRAAEFLVLRAARQSGRNYVAVRFGNVLGSRGSVVPTFKKQIAMGGPITVTHPDMTRYFMTISEAVQLVLQASVLGKGGEVFMMDMGDPVKIVDLARDLVNLSGLELHRDIDIHFTGLRPGEKLCEELFVERETYERIAHAKLFVARNASDALPPTLVTVLEEMEAALYTSSREQVIRCLQLLIPEFQPDEARNARPLFDELSGQETQENAIVKAIGKRGKGEDERAVTCGITVVETAEIRPDEWPVLARSDAT